MNISNSRRATIVNGTEDSDVIENSGRSATINAGASNDTVNNSGDLALVNGDAGNDRIENSSGMGSGSTLNGGAGADTINNTILKVTINGGSGDDSIRNTGAEVSINGGEDADTITNSGANVTIIGGDGNNRIYNSGANVKITSGNGFDSIKNDSANASISTGDENDTVENNGNATTINLGKGDDSVRNNAWNVSIVGGDGADRLLNYNYCGGMTIDAGNDNDFIYFDWNNDDVYVKAGPGDDEVRIYNSSDQMTIDAGTGNDTIRNHFHNYDRNDYGCKNGSINGGAGDDFIWQYRHCDNVTIIGGTGNDTIFNDYYSNNVVINAGTGNDSINNYADDVQITGGTGDDTIHNRGSNVAINTGDGADYITINDSATHSNVFVSSGADNDEIYVNINFSEVLLNAGSGNDYINNVGAKGTVKGGTGNDEIDLPYARPNDNYYNVLEYAGGDGKDTVYGYNELDTILITDDSSYSTSRSGSNVIVKVGSGSILLEGAYGMKINVTKGAGSSYINSIVNTQSNMLISGTDETDLITSSGDNVTIQGEEGNDTITGSDNGELILVASNHGNDLITNFGTNDTLQCTAGSIATVRTVGSDAVVSLKGSAYSSVVTLGGAGAYKFVQNGNVLTVNNIIKNTVANKEVSGTSGTDSITNTAAGVTIQGNEGNDTITGSNNGELILVASNHGNDLITNFGTNDTLQCTAGSIATVRTVGSDAVVSLKGASYSSTVTLKGAGAYDFAQNGNVLTVKVNVIKNTTANKKVSGTSSIDSIRSTAANVTIQGNGGDDTITGSAYGDVFLVASNHGNDLITNFDENDTLKCTAGSIATVRTVGKDAVVSLKGASYSSTVTLKGAGGLNFNQSDNVLTVVPESNYIVNSADGVKVVGTDGNDYIFNTGDKVTIQGNGGNDTFEGSEDYSEQFWFSSADGNNVITNFGKGDTLRMTAGKTLSYATVSSDVLVTLKGASYTGTVKLIDAAGKTLKQSGMYLIADDVNTITNRTDSIKVTGTNGKDLIINSGEHVTIEGNEGNDTIEGSSHGEMILVASNHGNDVITNFGANDTLQMTAGKTITWSTSGKNVIVTIAGASYTGTVTLQDAAGMNFVKSANGKYLAVAGGSNTITNNKSNVKINGTDGADWIENTGANVTIEAKGGNDTIIGSSFNELFLFSGADGNNYVMNFGENDTLRCTSGSIDRVNISDNNAIVQIKSGNLLSNVTLEGAGDYDFDQTSTVLTVNSGNRIINRTDKKMVEGTSGDDNIINYGANVTINGGAGNDTITGSDDYGDLYLFASNTGNNVVTNFGANDTIRCTAGSIATIKTSGDNAIVSLKGASYSGTVTLKGVADYGFKISGNYITVKDVNYIDNAKSGVKISGTSGKDYITNSGSGVTIQGNAGNDTIIGSNLGEMFLFSSADGNNVITNFGTNDTLKCTAGNIATVRTVGSDAVVSLKGAAYSGTVTLKNAADHEFVKSGNVLTVKSEIEPLVNSADGVKFSGTSGADYMINSGTNVTIQAGEGDDTIEGANDGKELFQFGAADGNDIVYNFGTNDTLKVTLGDITSYYASGNDYVVEVGQSTLYSGSVTLKNVGAIKVSGKNVTATRTNSQLPVEDYWFESGSNDESPLNEIMLTEAALDLSTDILSHPPALGSLQLPMLNRSARHRQK